ncbi:MAG: SPFH/Band 7/PHB domain protein [Anaerolineae bacterium]|nr:SPFH/Band 7/PHB domain protein [Anaerolineae bacterium]
MFDSEEYGPSWFHKRFPPEQLVHRRNHQWRANIRLGLFLLALLLALGPVFLFNFLLFGGDIDPIWAALGTLPTLIALLGALLIAGLFVKMVYSLDSWGAGFRFTVLCLFGRPWPFPYPFAVISEGKVRDTDQRKFIANRQLGGPGKIIIQNDSAVVLERYGRISRVEGPGLVFLDRSERIREILDLRPQVRTIPAARAYTKDGIAVDTEISVRFQIRCGSPCLEKPYPASKAALEQAARAEARRIADSGLPGRFDWKGRVMGNVDSTLREIVAGKSLDQLFEPADLNKDPRQEIGQEMLDRLRQQSASFGVHVLDVMLGPFKPVDPSIERQMRAAWQSGRNAEDRVEEAHGQAQTMLARETAYAYAQLEMMLAIDRGFQKLVNQDKRLPPYFVALRFLKTIQEIAVNPGVGPFLPLETIKSLEFLNNLLESPTPGASPSSSRPLIN